jgi:hypothetical protein
MPGTTKLAKASSNLTDRNEFILRESPAGKNVSMESEDTVEFRHQATTGEDTVDWEDSMCSGDLQSVWISDSAVLNCSYDM